MPADRPRLPLKRAALWVFIASIVLSALLGIWALLAGDFGELQVRVLFSSLGVSGASLCAMAGAALLESRGERALPLAAMALSVVGLVLLLIGIWSEREDELFWKPTGTVAIFAAATAHASLLRLARLGRRSAWLRTTGTALVLALALYGSVMVWAESDDDQVFRGLGVLSILATAATLATPVLHRLSREELARTARPAGAPGAPVALLCPACGGRLEAPLGQVDCPRCGARFRVELTPR